MLFRYPNEPWIRGQWILAKKDYKKVLKYKTNLFKENILKQIQTLESNNPKEYWKLVEKLRTNAKNRGSSAEVIDDNDWFLYFQKLNKNPLQTRKTVFERDLDFFANHIDKFANPHNNTLDREIQLNEIAKAAKHLKNEKSSGIDSISNEMIKCSLGVFGSLYARIFNKILNDGIFPRKWNGGYVMPMFKAGETADPGNYRGITINSCLGKLFTLVLNGRFTTFLESEDVISPSQIGFRKGYRTADHIFILKAILNRFFKDNKYVYACFVDFRKAVKFIISSIVRIFSPMKRPLRNPVPAVFVLFFDVFSFLLPVLNRRFSNVHLYHFPEQGVVHILSSLY